MTEEQIVKNLAQLEEMLARAQAKQAAIIVGAHKLGENTGKPIYQTAEAYEAGGMANAQIGRAIADVKRWHDALAVHGSQRFGK